MEKTNAYTKNQLVGLLSINRATLDKVIVSQSVKPVGKSGAWLTFDVDAVRYAIQKDLEEVKERNSIDKIQTTHDADNNFHSLDDELKAIRIKNLQLDYDERVGNLVPYQQASDLFNKCFAHYIQTIKDICYLYSVPPDKYNEIVNTTKHQIREYIEESDLKLVKIDESITKLDGEEYAI